MRYKEFNYTIDPKIVGHSPSGTHIQKRTKETLYTLDNLPVGGFPDFNVDFDGFQIWRASKLNDVLSPFDGTGFLVSPNFKSFLEKMNLPPHKFYEAGVRYPNQSKHIYYYLHFAFDFRREVDYESSIFKLVTKDNKTHQIIAEEPISIKSFDEHKKASDYDLFTDEYYRSVNAYKYCLPNEERFDLYPRIAGFACSPRFVTEASNKAYTGFRFSDLSHY